MAQYAECPGVLLSMVELTAELATYLACILCQVVQDTLNLALI